MKRISSLYLTLLAVGSLVVPTAVAQTAFQEEEPAFELAPFAVTADGAQSVLFITSRDLNERQASDLEDTLSIDPSVTVGGSTAIAQKIYVRNLGEGLINVSVDGATQSGSLFHHTGRIAIEPELLKQVEVQPGVGNATDGPGALGGAIRFVTKDPEDMLADGQTVGAQTKYTYFSNTDGHKGSVIGYGRLSDGWSILASYVGSEHEEIEDGDGNELAGSGSRQDVIMTKVVGHFGDGHTVRASFEHLDEEGEKLRRPEWAPSPGNPSYPMESERKTGTVGYSFDPASIEWIDLEFTASYTTAELMQNGSYGPYEGKVEGLQFDLRNHQEVGITKVTYGIDYRRDEVEAGSVGSSVRETERGNVTGLFAQSEFDFTEAFTLTGGARLDYYRLKDRQDQRFTDNGFSPNIGAIYRLTPELSINASAATAFRGPDVADAFRVDIADNDPDLEAEKARNYELRLMYEQGGLLLEGGVYRNEIHDVITNTTPWDRHYLNAGDVETDGVFVRAVYSTERYNLSLQYNHADTTINGQTATRYQYSSLVSRIGDTWVADATWRPLDQLDVGWNVRYVQGLDDISIPESITGGVPGVSIDKPGYVTHDFFLRWRPEFFEYLTLNLTVKNIFDKQYLSHGSVEDMRNMPGTGWESTVGAPEQGRDIRLSATLRF
ncbi:MAG: TonB-dependent receptor [Verrucomicrobiota bacterium JB022]|nr:TonB-dependent receptor [Verrucomicrobiota bacterium JB022]